MPISIYQEQSSSQPNGTTTNNNQPSTTGNNNSSAHATTTSLAGASFPSAVNEQGQPLSKEEADRLYEERMEEEYAKREGGA
ncbi:uncharacterized protein BDV14DRAFT_184665 [Aspergillus stella-maris]|uniref:uncharacterized protein n=1 Tax=Aspergillus stella-maris TaxID=1810926 RepID=UPI003CCD93B1